MPGQDTRIFTDANFNEQVLTSDVPVLVDVWTEGCVACMRLAPVIDLVAGEYAGKAKVGKLDAMSNLDTAMRYHVRSLPTLLLFKRGNVVMQHAGAIDKTDLEELLNLHL